MFIASSKIGSAPHNPVIDAPLVSLMNTDPRIVKRFGESQRTLEETIVALNPADDKEIALGLIDPSVPYDKTGVLDRRIQACI